MNNNIVGPLDGIRVLEWSMFQMAPWAGVMLADFGADVIKIEPPNVGEMARGLIAAKVLAEMEKQGKIEEAKNIQQQMAQMGMLPYGKNPYFEANNRGKKGITLDLTKARGKEILYCLIKNCDVFLHNHRQGHPERMGLDYDTLRKYNPKIIYAAASGYGPKGPEASEPAYDAMGQARSGLMTKVGEPGMPPLYHTAGVCDQIGAIMTAYGIIAALLARERFGIGQKVDVSHLGSSMTLLGLAVSLELYTGIDPPLVARRSRKAAPNPLWNYYRCKDGKYVMLGMLDSDRYWPVTCKALGIEYLGKAPKFESQKQRAVNCEELIAIMDKCFLSKTVPEWTKTFRQTGDSIICVVQNVSDLPNDPQVIANNYVIDCNHEVLGAVKVLGITTQLSNTPGEVRPEAPEFGQHTEEVLIEVGGYTWDDIVKFKDEGVI